MNYTRCVALGLFDDADAARGASTALKAVGFASDDIGLLECRRGPARATPQMARLGVNRQGSRRKHVAPIELYPTDLGPIGGMLLSKGMPVDQARYYADEVRRGNSLVAVRIEVNPALVETILHRYGAYDVRPFSGNPRAQLAS